MARKPDAYYKQMVRTLRHGFVDAEKTDSLYVTDAKTRARQGLSPVTKAAAIRDLKSAGYIIGKETEFNARTGELTDVRRTGKIARSFEARDGFNLRDVSKLTPQQKAHITRTFNTVQKLSAQPYQEFRSPKAENLERVQEASHGGIKTPDELVLAFVPVARPSERAEIRILPDRIEVIERDVKRTPTTWADAGLKLKDVADDPVAAIRAMVAFTGGDQFQFMSVNAPMFGLAYDAESLEAELKQLQKDYKSRWQNFLTGIQAFTAPTATKIKDYRVTKDTAKRAQKKQRQQSATAFRRKIRAEEKRRKATAKRQRKARATTRKRK
jgi:hypothetical protein